DAEKSPILQCPQESSFSRTAKASDDDKRRCLHGRKGGSFTQLIFLRIRRSPSSFRLDPPDVTVPALKNNIQAFGGGIPENQEVGVGTADLDSRVINTHRFRCNFVGADDSGKLLADHFLNLEDGSRGDDIALVVVVPLARDVALLVSKDL